MKKNSTTLRNRVQTGLKAWSVLLAVQAIAIWVYLATLSTSAKGFSTPRLAMLAALGLVTLASIRLAAVLLFKPGQIEKQTGWLTDHLETHNLEITLLSGLVTAAGLLLAVQWALLPPSYEVGIALKRLVPLLILVTCTGIEILALAIIVQSQLHPGRAAAQWVDLITHQPGRFSRFLCWVIVLLAALSLAGQAVKFFLPTYFRFVDFLTVEFSLDSEKNIPTYFTALLMTANAVTFAWISWQTRRARLSFSKYWAFLAFLFVVLPLDEIFSLHERLTEPVQAHIYAVGLLYWPWFLPLLPALAILFFVYLRFFQKLPGRTFKLFMLSAALYLGAAIVLEAIGAAYADEYGLATFVYALQVALEECTEMAGLVLLLYTLLDYHRAVFLDDKVQHPAALPAAVKPGDRSQKVADPTGPDPAEKSLDI